MPNYPNENSYDPKKSLHKAADKRLTGPEHLRNKMNDNADENMQGRRIWQSTLATRATARERRNSQFSSQVDEDNLCKFKWQFLQI